MAAPAEVRQSVEEVDDEETARRLRSAQQSINEAHRRWLKKGEVCDLIANRRLYGIPLSSAAPYRPPSACGIFMLNDRRPLKAVATVFCPIAGGSVFLFDRQRTRFFRKDG